MKKKFSIGISPCPNDTFIFYALLNNKIDTKGLEFNVVFEDVSKLNEMAFNNTLDITKLSFHTYAYVREKYDLLDAGSALGNNCGPILIAQRKLTDEDVTKGSVAIPGAFTTANFLLKYRFPNLKKTSTFLFSEIEDAVIDKKVDTGLIIHENRFTFQEKGLVQLADLGAYWEDTTNLPIPLGGIVIDNTIDKKTQQSINKLIVKSIEYAHNNEPEVLSFCKQYAQEMNIAVMKSHIDLYVNQYSLSLGEKGNTAVKELITTIKNRPQVK